jgi:hypothetical protein
MYLIRSLAPEIDFANDHVSATSLSAGSAGGKTLPSATTGEVGQSRQLQVDTILRALLDKITYSINLITI